MTAGRSEDGDHRVPDDPSPPTVDELLGKLGVTANQRAQVNALAERLYGHVFRAVNMTALHALEQLLWSELDQLEIHDELGDLATALLAAALLRVGHDPARAVDGLPGGITDAEQIAASYEDGCRMCSHELAEAKRGQASPCGEQRVDDDPEWRELEASAARDWRAEHAAALRRHGVG